jgi:Arc/MetJ-type ribon-helix-helix transcriptional regulator
MEDRYMAHTLTDPQKRLMRELLKVGRWNNESEILRYGLHLVAREVRDEEARSLEPISKDALARAYRKMSRQERADERKMAAASARPQPGELE